MFTPGLTPTRVQVPGACTPHPCPSPSSVYRCRPMAGGTTALEAQGIAWREREKHWGVSVPRHGVATGLFGTRRPAWRQQRTTPGGEQSHESATDPGPGTGRSGRYRHAPPGPGEVRVRVTLVNTCPQWDLHLDAGEPMFVGQQISYPLHPPASPATRWWAWWMRSARTSPPSGWASGMAAWRDAGHHRQGCYAEFCQPPEANLLPVPDHVEDRAVASRWNWRCVWLSRSLPLKRPGAIEGKRAADQRARARRDDRRPDAPRRGRRLR